MIIEKEISNDITLGVYGQGNVNKIPKGLSGIYSWHVQVDKTNFSTLSNYSRYFTSKKYNAEIKSKFRESYRGDLKLSSTNDGSNDLQTYNEGDPLLQALIMTTTFMESPPIYIGKSNEISSRVSVHKNIINDIIVSRGNYEYSKENYTNDDEPDPDFYDLGRFSDRFVALYEEISTDTYSIRTQNLFVKVIGVKKDLDSKFLLDLESYLNHTFKPSLGKR